MASEEELDRAVRREIPIICQKVKKTRMLNPSKDPVIWDYPAMVVACSAIKIDKCLTGESHFPGNIKFSPELEAKLLTLGRIGAFPDEGDSLPIVGACAEPHAAESVIRKYPWTRLSDLQFSKAYRPRTAQRKKYCRNCKKTFNI